MKALNVYQINLIQTLKSMHKTKYVKNPLIFLPKFREVDHNTRQDFPKIASAIKDLLLKPPTLQ